MRITRASSIPAAGPDRDRLVLEQICWDLRRMEMQARAIDQPLLSFMLDQAACLASDELSRVAAASPDAAEPRRRATS
jgi:hypothetical protein